MALLIGGSAAAVALIFLFSGILQSPSDWLWTHLFQVGVSADSTNFGRPWLEVSSTLLIGIGSAWLLIEATRPWQKAILAIGAVAVTLLLPPTMASLSLYLNALAPLLAVTLSVASALLYGRTKDGRRKALLETALGDRVSAASFARLLRHPGDISFSPAEKEITVLICRLLIPTESAASGSKTPPETIARIGSAYNQAVLPVLLSSGAYLEDESPDAIRASFGMFDPIENHPENHASQACTAALALLPRLRSFVRDCHSRYGITPSIAMGIHSGKVTVGLLGEGANSRLISLGEVAILADRLALANARYRAEILLSPETYRRVETQIEVRPIELLYDPVHQRLTEIYQLLALAKDFSEADRTLRDAFWQGIIHYRAGSFREAINCFRRASVVGIDDPPLSFLMGQLQEKLELTSPRSLHLIQTLSDKGGIRLEEHL